HAEYLRQLLPPHRAPGGQPAARPARAREHPHGHVRRDADVARDARALDSRESSGHAGADPASGRRHEPGKESRGSEEHVAAAPAGDAPHEPALRVVPQNHGPDRVRARELRSGRHLAGHRRQVSGGCERPARRRNEAQRPCRPPPGAAVPIGRLRHERDRETLHVRARPAGAILRHARDSERRAPSCAERLPLLIRRARGRVERRVSDENEEDRSDERELRSKKLEVRTMFITKKHLSRRTFLHGVGVTVALPFLESMVPAATALAETAAKGRARFGAIYFPHGATMDKWTPAADGSSFDLSEILQPLKPFQKQINIISDLSHPQAYGGGSATSNHNRSAATFLSGAHAEAGPKPHLGITMDQY